MMARATVSERPQDKERLLVEAAQKDPERFTELYEMNFSLVYAFVSRRVSDREAVEDITSDVFHKALAQLPKFEWRGAPFSAWLLRIAANAITDRFNRTNRETNLDDPNNLLSSSPVPAAEIEAAQQRAQLFHIVEQLPADQRRVIQMRFAEEKSIREIAQELKRTEGAVKQLQLRALAKLRSQMEAANA